VHLVNRHYLRSCPRGLRHPRCHLGRQERLQEIRRYHFHPRFYRQHQLRFLRLDLRHPLDHPKDPLLLRLGYQDLHRQGQIRQGRVRQGHPHQPQQVNSNPLLHLRLLRLNHLRHLGPHQNLELLPQLPEPRRGGLEYLRHQQIPLHLEVAHQRQYPNLQQTH